MPSVFSYVVSHDSGFAPNPFGGVLTLATCKPVIRRAAREGDWLIGTGSVRNVGAGRLIYAARVSRVITLEDYGASDEYAQKRPRLSDRDQRHGDNIYYRDETGNWRQRRNLNHGSKHVARDVSGLNVLICSSFWYFGSEAPTIPPVLETLIKTGPGHRRARGRDLVQALDSWLHQFPQGVLGPPSNQRARPSGEEESGGC